jgi:copper homeostasis protein (lipoprotein)
MYPGYLIMKYLALLASLALFSCTQRKVDLTNKEQVYQGIIPCADCPGIKSTLVLLPDSTFTLTDEYLERQAEPVKTTGTFEMKHGFGEDTNAEYLTLHPTGSGTSRFFVKYSNSPGEVTMLDGEGKAIKSDLNFTLKAPATK